MKPGDKIYCHTTGYFRNSSTSRIFAKEGKCYDIIDVVNFESGDFNIVFISETGNAHTWTNIDMFHEHFSIPMIRHDIKKHKMV